jgi:hypothetical protein
MGLEPMISSSTLLLLEKEVLFEIGSNLKAFFLLVTTPMGLEPMTSPSSYKRGGGGGGGPGVI